jgi:hypothetical protein
MSAAWLLTALLNMDPSSVPAPSLAKQNRPSPRQLLMALRENRRQLMELIESTTPTAVPAATSPSRRSENQLPTAMA